MKTPMTISNPMVYLQLKREGIIYTFRRRKRKYEGKVWIRRKRGGRKEFDATAKLIEKTEPPIESTLRPYLTQSGFNFLEVWKSEIDRLHSSRNGYLFKVEREDKEIQRIESIE